MPAKPTQATAERIRVKIAECEAVLGTLKARLAKIDARAEGRPEPQTGLDILWAAALPMARQRSSKHRCRVAWNRLPAKERPPLEIALSALRLWNRCEQWSASDNLYAPGLHRFIAERMWESLPENSRKDPLARYRTRHEPIPETDPADAVTDPGEIARLLSLKVMSHES